MVGSEPMTAGGKTQLFDISSMPFVPKPLSLPSKRPTVGRAVVAVAAANASRPAARLPHSGSEKSARSRSSAPCRSMNGASCRTRSRPGRDGYARGACATAYRHGRTTRQAHVDRAKAAGAGMRRPGPTPAVMRTGSISAGRPANGPHPGATTTALAGRGEADGCRWRKTRR